MRRRLVLVAVSAGGRRRAQGRFRLARTAPKRRASVPSTVPRLIGRGRQCDTHFLRCSPASGDQKTVEILDCSDRVLPVGLPIYPSIFF
jgi:hypothetical protein